MLGHLVSEFIKAKLAPTILGKLGRAVLNEPITALKCAAASTLASPSSLVDAPGNVANLLRLKPTEGKNFLDANNYYRDRFGVSESQINTPIGELSPDLKVLRTQFQEIQARVNKHGSCTAGTIAGAVAGGVGTAVVISAATGGIAAAPLTLRTATTTHAAYMSAAITIQGSSIALAADTVIGLTRETFAPAP